MTLTEEQRGTAAFDLEKARDVCADMEKFRGRTIQCTHIEAHLAAAMLPEALAEIERLRAENLELQVAVLGPDSIRAHQAGIIEKQAARIEELEAALVDCQYAPQPNGCDDWGNPIILSVSGGAYTGTTRSWQITDERVEALKQAAHTCHEVTAFDIAKVLQAMLKEAGQ